ncbi:hypothetical protein [Azohydromonas aeria]|uniref:hypothetical protein n=1 Tax=Azohydromonas aeria TaxID=2590212 RepID=UPI0012FCE43F|nr:hypothetical protein [Azohydromonas aeria]
MSQFELHLYRTKFIKPAQKGLFDPQITPQAMFIEGIADRPSIESRRENVWRIGNIEYIDNTTGRFAIGRDARAAQEKFDKDSRNFVRQIEQTGPYTYVYFDSRIGLLGIAKKTKLASDVEAIADKIKKLLSVSPLVMQNQIDVRVDKILDPESFLKKIRSAHSIKKFTASFTGPNPIDADEIFQKPLAFYCQQVGGDHGSVTVQGASLNEDVVEAVAKSTAATANKASAIIKVAAQSRSTKVEFGEHAKKAFAEVDEKMEDVMEAVLKAYREVQNDKVIRREKH